MIRRGRRVSPMHDWKSFGSVALRETGLEMLAGTNGSKSAASDDQLLFNDTAHVPNIYRDVFG